MAKDFLYKLLTIEPADRYTALNASNHPWLTRNLQDSIPFSLNEKFYIFGNITSFIRIIKVFMFIKYIEKKCHMQYTM